MRNVKPLRSLATFGLVLSAATLFACGGGTEKAVPATDSAAAALAPPPAESFALVATDGSWMVDITPANIVWQKTKGANRDTIEFDFKAPDVKGALIDYTSIRMAADTHRIDITLAMTPCTDNAKNQYTHKAQVWVDQQSYTGCATKK